jgi:D-alanyl-D-alanine carboxypeptidase
MTGHAIVRQIQRKQNSARSVSRAFPAAAIMAASLFAVCTVSGSPPERAKKLEELLHDKFQVERERVGFPGATIAFVLRDGTPGATAVGFADVEKKIPMRPSDRLFSGSTGKTFVAAVTLQLADEGKLSLDDKIEKYLGHYPWFVHLPNSRELTVRNLMNHTSGIPNHVEMADFAAAIRKNPMRVWKPEQIIAFELNKKPMFPAGRGWSYADTNYILVGMIIERITKEDYYSELQHRILVPLHLTRTSPSIQPTLAGLVPGYTDPSLPFGLPAKVAANGTYDFNPQLEWTGGGLITTSSDLARWSKALYEADVFSQKSLQQMITTVKTTRPGVSYGLACEMRPNTPLGAAYGHYGEMPGYLTVMAYYPQYRFAVAIQFNSDDPKYFHDKDEGAYADEAAAIIKETSYRQ